MSFLDSLRVRNTLASLFQPQINQSPVQASMPDQSQPSSGTDPDSIIKSLLTPQTGSEDRLRQILDTMPKREDYAPSTGRKILAGIVGLGGNDAMGMSGGQPVGFVNHPKESFEARNQILDEPYNEAMSAFNAQLRPLNELSQAERSANTNSRLTAATLLRDQNQDAEHQRKVTADEAKNQLDQDKLAQKREFAAIVKAKNEMPNAAMAEDKDGKVYTWDRKTGQFIGYVTNETGDVVESSKLPEQEKLQLQQNNELQRITARGSQARQNIAAQGNKEVDVSNKTLSNKKDLKQTVPGKAASASSSPKDTSGKRVTIVDPKGNAYTLPEGQLSAFLAKNSDWKVK